MPLIRLPSPPLPQFIKTLPVWVRVVLTMLRDALLYLAVVAVLLGFVALLVALSVKYEMAHSIITGAFGVTMLVLVSFLALMYLVDVHASVQPHVQPRLRNPAPESKHES